jgi:peptidoglycan/LPS O-acetylase OafA/YrhL
MLIEKPAYIPALTGLRGFAALSVVAFHLYAFLGSPALVVFGFNVLAFLQAGHYGVDLFFVLSGYLLSRPFIDAMLEKKQAPKWLSFWWQRCLRILPAYWFQLIVLISLTGWGAYSLKTLLMHASLTFNLIKNPSALNPVYWSLPVEWNFYLVMPFIAWLFRSSKYFLWLVFLSIVFSITFRIICWQTLFSSGNDGLWLFRLIIQLPGRIDQFMIGMLAAWLVAVYAKTLLHYCLLITLISISMIAATAAMTLHLGDVLDASRVPWVYFQQTIAALGFAGLIITASVSKTGLSVLWSTHFMHFSGLISFSLYLWHYPIGQFLLQKMPAGAGFFILFLVLSFLVSYASWRWIEQPFIRK